MLRIPFEEIKQTLVTILEKYDFSPAKTKIIAETHTQSSCDGVYSHGLNRFPLFIEYVEKGLIDITAEPEKVASFGTMERWDGRMGPGVTNAHHCMERALELAKDHTLGAVALRNTNHWMRGGTYGWKAVNKGMIAICFTNTTPNMPPWGGKESRIGNNPFIIAIPRSRGHVVLDMSMSQFSFGKIHNYKLNNEQLPFPGGWDEQGNLTRDPKKILARERGLPIGYWKGSALSMVLDMLAALLSDGKSTREIGSKEYETGISQVFLCIDPAKFSDGNLKDQLLDNIIDYVHDVPPMNKGDHTYYPGERTLATRKEQLKNGIRVSEEIWETINQLKDQ
ncbi:3-dehydro-L-gulonate 2-dehydrogenase [Fodinibius sediminis]|uniref:3-dehydro-L-gulonate 2-dehydrogenase n=1 Tax=Fodinibius sediminis TaxID=1214077 RepID=A0A521DB01_9BACT|nr:3-dehydro-L-gulonate 2-dehydrogenase [Fodinibius sediminis]SMO68897.1 3-dehydro-L-gulonate 2-dehydrogenase [Fodinibius sediminis]